MEATRVKSFAQQLQGNMVALISLAIALSSLSYSTWRNERTELNRNQPYAGFEILLKLNELQQVVFHRRYDMDDLEKGNPRLGWTYALTINDLSQVMPPILQQKSQNLISTWNGNWENLGEDQTSVNAVLKSIDAMRAETLHQIKALD